MKPGLNCRKGDYYRYLAEFMIENDKKEVADQSLKAYEVALSCAMVTLIFKFQVSSLFLT